MPGEALARRYVISGTVQGVGFRFFVQDVAARLGITGYVRNRFDGAVEVYAVGDAMQLQTLRAELARGPRMAAVQNVSEQNAAIMNDYSSGFSIEGTD